MGRIKSNKTPQITAKGSKKSKASDKTNKSVDLSQVSCNLTERVLTRSKRSLTTVFQNEEPKGKKAKVHPKQSEAAELAKNSAPAKQKKSVGALGQNNNATIGLMPSMPEAAQNVSEMDIEPIVGTSKSLIDSLKRKKSVIKPKVVSTNDPTKRGAESSVTGRQSVTGSQERGDGIQVEVNPADDDYCEYETYSQDDFSQNDEDEESSEDDRSSNSSGSSDDSESSEDNEPEANRRRKESPVPERPRPKVQSAPEQSTREERLRLLRDDPDVQQLLLEARRSAVKGHGTKGNTNRKNTNHVKLPSDTTIYGPALCKMVTENQVSPKVNPTERDRDRCRSTIDKLSNFVEEL